MIFIQYVPLIVIVTKLIAPLCVDLTSRDILEFIMGIMKICFHKCRISYNTYKAFQQYQKCGQITL